MTNKIKIIAKESVCIGSGQCAMRLPKVFIQSEDDGLVELLVDEADPSLLNTLQNIVDTCPSRALSLQYDKSLAKSVCPHLNASRSSDYTENNTIYEFPIFDKDFKANPFKLYNMWIKEGKPIVKIELPTGVKTWLVINHDFAKSLLNDDRLSKDSSYASANWHKSHPTHKNGTSQPVFKHILTMDPPEHTRIRDMVSHAFTPKLIKQLRPRIESITKELLDDISDQQGTIDLIESFALPLPLKVICELLGVPFEDERLFKRWSEILVTGNQEEQKLIPVAGQELNDYLLQLSEIKSRTPDSSLFSALVQFKEEGALSEKELTAMGFLLLVAGHETTVNLIGNGTLALLSHREEWVKLCNNADITRRAVEELLRFGSPVEVSTQRFAKEDIEIQGINIKQGDTIFISIGSANRDQTVFHEAEKLDITRPDVSSHLAFGAGSHFCLGAPLARLEGEVAFSELSRRFPNMKVAVPFDDLEWRVGLVMRGLKTLPVILHP